MPFPFELCGVIIHQGFGQEPATRHSKAVDSAASQMAFPVHVRSGSRSGRRVTFRHGPGELSCRMKAFARPHWRVLSA